MSQPSPLAVALALVDPANDAHWTTDGQVRVDVVNELLEQLGSERPVGRQDIIDAIPTYTRETAPAFVAAHAEARSRAVAAVHAASALAPRAGQLAAAQSPVSGAPSLNGAPLEPSRSALAVPIGQLLASPELLRSAIVELDAQSQALIAKRREIDAELVVIGQRAELCARALTRIEPPEDPANGIAAYLKRSAETRHSRIARTRNFIAAGVTAKDVAAELAGPSRLDSAMGRRRGGFGGQRPAPRVPPQVTAGGA